MTDKDILQFLHKGSENAISREQLVILTGQDDRTNRDAIHRLRLAGHYIMSDSGGKGYWIAEDSKEVEKFLKEAKHRRDSQYYPEMTRRFYAETGQRVTVVKEHIRKVG